MQPLFKHLILVTTALLLPFTASAYDPGTEACLKKSKGLAMQIDVDRLKRSSVEVEGVKLVINGPITPEMAAQVHKFLTSPRETIQVIELNSTGGDVNTGLAIAEEIHKLGLKTSIAAHGVCLSICAGIFQAGKTRYMDAKSVIGYSNTNIKAMPDSSPLATLVSFGTAKMTAAKNVDQFEQWGLDQRLRGETMKSSNDSIYCLDSGEARSFNAVNSPQAAPKKCTGNVLCGWPGPYSSN